MYAAALPVAGKKGKAGILRPQDGIRMMTKAVFLQPG
jgi:hypothetical protein